MTWCGLLLSNRLHRSMPLSRYASRCPLVALHRSRGCDVFVSVSTPKAMLITPLLVLSFFGFKGGPDPSAAAAQQQRYTALTSEGARVAVVYAGRQLEDFAAVSARDYSFSLGDNSGAKRRERRPWFRVGMVAVSEGIEIASAVLAQKKLLVDSARATYKELRPLQLAFSYAALEDVQQAEIAQEPLRLGSYNCADCGSYNDASAEACGNCGAPRDDCSPRGLLSAVGRRRGLTACRIHECGFAPWD